MSYEIF